MSKRTRKKFSSISLPLNIRLTVEPGRLEIIYTNRNRIGGLWPLFLATLLAFVCINGTITEFEKGATWSLLPFIPFYLVWLFLLGAAARLYNFAN